MKNGEPDLTNEVLQEEALAWHVRLNSGDATAEDFDAFSEWLDVDPKRFEAYSAIEDLEMDIQAMAASDAGLQPSMTEPTAPAAHRTARPRRFDMAARIGMALAACAAITLVLVQTVPFPGGTSQEEFLVADAELQLVTVLEDRSVVTLAPGGQGALSVTDEQRKVARFSGAGYFDITSDSQRPFSVEFPAGRVEVLGTRFELSVFEDQVFVAVDEGRVRLSAPNNSTHILEAGFGYLMPGTAEAGRLLQFEASDRVDWSSGAMTFTDASIDEIFDRFNLIYGPGSFRFEAPQGTLRTFSGVIPVRGPDQTGRLISDLFDLEIDVRSDGAVFRLRP